MWKKKKMKNDPVTNKYIQMLNAKFCAIHKNVY